MTGNLYPTMWQRTLQSFVGKQIRLRTQDGSVFRGWLEEIGPDSVKVQPKGSVVLYADLRECTEAGDHV